MAQQLAQGAVQTSPGEVPASAAGPTNAVGFDRLRSLLRRSGGSNKGQAAATEGDAVAMESGDLEGQRPQEPAAVAALVSDACMPAALDQLDGPLHLASGLGSLERVRACLAAGHDVDARGAFNFTPLFWAAQAGNLGAVRELLARGALVDSRDCYGTTPLVLATVAGNTEVVRELLSHSAHPDAPGSTASPLICATSAGNVVLVEALLSHGACTERRQPDGRTALHVAASRGRAPIVQLLLGRGCCLDAQDTHSFTPLHYAAGHGHLEVVEMLHGAGASMSVQDGNALTPLHLAAGGGHSEVARFLIQHGADVNSMNPPHYILPIALAAAGSCLTTFQVLLDAGAILHLDGIKRRVASPEGAGLEGAGLEPAACLIDPSSRPSAAMQGVQLNPLFNTAIAIGIIADYEAPAFSLLKRGA